MTVTDENRHSRAHVDIILIALVFGMSLFGIVAVCVATFSPGGDPDASFLNHIFGSSYATRQCLFLLLAPGGVPYPRQIGIDCDKSRQTAATAGIGYYCFTTVQWTEKQLCIKEIGGAGVISSDTAFFCFSPACPQTLPRASLRDRPSQQQARA